MNKWEELKERERLEQIAYEKMCFACPNAKKCHEECEFCDDFENEVERLSKRKEPIVERAVKYEKARERVKIINIIGLSTTLFIWLVVLTLFVVRLINS